METCRRRQQLPLAAATRTLIPGYIRALLVITVVTAMLPTSRAVDVFDSISTSIDIEPSSTFSVVASSSDGGGNDKDACDRFPCKNGGTCIIVHSTFNCICPEGYTGRTCEREVANTLYPHGFQQGDGVLGDTDDGSSSRQWVEHGIQIYGHRYRNFFANMNGYVTMQLSYTDPTPTPPDDETGELLQHDDDMVMFAPLWVDNNGGPATGNDSVVFHQIYTKWSDNHVVDDRTTAMINLATGHIHDYTGRVDFKASNVIVATWNKMKPYSSVVVGDDDDDDDDDDDEEEEVCYYQAVCISDHSLYRTYVMFNYNYCTYDTSRANAVFTLAPKTLGSVEYLVNKWGYSGTGKAFEMPGLPGNVGPDVNGRILFRVTDDADEDPFGSEYQCRIWMVNQMNNEANIKSWVQQVDDQLPCPCTVMQAILDCRFIYSSEEQCFLTRTEPAQRCCYDRTRPTQRRLIVRFWEWLLVDIPLMVKEDYAAGSFIVSNQILNPYRYDASDATPKRHCCAQSDLCHVFYKYRPQNKCKGYKPPFMSWLFGDPHIRTLDGLQYTYNGFGEFWMQKPTRTPLENYFRMQARTSWAWDEQGNRLQATVFVAFAAKDVKSARVHVELSEDRKTMIILADDNEYDLTSWFYNTTSNEPERHYKDVFFRRLVDFVYIQFPSGVAMRLGVRGDQLDCLLIVEDEYQLEGHTGLLGTYNADQSDDFTMPSDSGLDQLPVDSSASDIHNIFGEAYRITTSESLFWYLKQDEAEQFQDTSFQPVMQPLVWDSEAERQAAEDLCRGDDACMYDVYVTKNTDFASVTRDISEKNIDTEVDVRNNVPTIDGPTEIHATVLQQFNATITVTDADVTDTVKLEYRNFPDDAIYDFVTGLFTWTPLDMSEVSDFKFVAMDSRNASAIDLQITVKLCNCSGHGDCDFENSLPEYNLTDSFQMVYCNCHEEWTGVYCETDLDACLDSPCLPLQNCTDMPASQHKALGKGFNCTTCPSGFVEILDVKCEDFDECAAGTDNCDTVTTSCTNIQGSFICTCKPNYVAINSDTECGDVDECALLLDDCSQKCINAFGGYNCSCYAGYKLAVADTKKCNANDVSLETKCNTTIPNCEGFCLDDGAGGVKCDCHAGYRLAGTEICEDIDECVEVFEPCGSNGSPICENTIGSYDCSCGAGFLQGDIRSCGNCEKGLTWGFECTRLCNCADEADCDFVTGCSQCPLGWTADPNDSGNGCDWDVDECSEDATLCGDHASCANTVGSYQCTCDEGYYRDINTCTEINECIDEEESTLSDYCQNGATCVDKFLDVECVCQPGFTGVRCETNIDECDPENSNSTQHCIHNSTCVDLVDNFDCDCVGDYFGHYCQHILTHIDVTTDSSGGGGVTDDGGQGGVTDDGDDDDDKEGGFPVLATALGSVLGAIVLVLLVFCLCYCCCWGAAADDSSSTTEDTQFTRPSHILPRPTWLHWYPGVALKPAYMVPAAYTGTGSRSSGPSTVRPSSRQVASAVQGTEAIDWSILKRFSNRTGGLRGPASTSGLHRGPAPYTSAGDFMWMPRSRATDLDTLNESSRSRGSRPSRPSRPRSQGGRPGEFSWVAK